MQKNTLKIIIALLIAVIIGEAAYFTSALNAEKQKTKPKLAGSGASIPMRILINTSEGSPAIGGETFTAGEWKNVSEKWFQDNSKELSEYPGIKEAWAILDEKMKQAIEEQGLRNFAQGLKEAAVQYNQVVPETADIILKIAPYETPNEIK